MTEVATSHSNLASHRFIFINILLAGLWWVLEASIHVLVFHESFEQLFRPDDHEIWMRSFVVILLIAFGTYAQRIVNARERAEQSVRDTHAELDQILQTAANGMGLNLSMAYGIVKNHGGAIGVLSEPNRGSLFKICLAAVEMES